MENILAKLKQIQENPGYFKGLTPEEQAELFLALLTPKKKILRKPVVITGIDGKTPVPDKDYLSKEASLRIMDDIRDSVQMTLRSIKPIKGDKGKDAEITPDLIEQIISDVLERVPLPEFPYETIKAVSDTQDTLVTITEDILDIKEDIEELKKEPKVVYQQGGTIGKQQVYGFIKQAVTDGLTAQYREVTSNYTITANDYTIGCSGNITITLPSATNFRSEYTIKNKGNGTVAVTGSNLIDDEVTQYLNPKSSMSVRSTGTEWIIV